MQVKASQFETEEECRKDLKFATVQTPICAEQPLASPLGPRGPRILTPPKSFATSDFQVPVCLVSFW